MSKIDLTPLVQAVITLTAALISAYLIPYLKAKLGTARFDKLLKYAKAGAKAAEQLMKNGTIKPEERFDHVVKYLEKKGFYLDADEIETLIESVVFDLPHASQEKSSLVGDSVRKDE